MHIILDAGQTSACIPTPETLILFPIKFPHVLFLQSHCDIHNSQICFTYRPSFTRWYPPSYQLLCESNLTLDAESNCSSCLHKP